MADPAFSRILTGDIPESPSPFLRAETQQPELPPMFVEDLLSLLAGLVDSRMGGMRGGFGAPQTQSIGMNTEDGSRGFGSPPPRDSQWNRWNSGGMGPGGLGDAYYRAGGGWYM